MICLCNNWSVWVLKLIKMCVSIVFCCIFFFWGGEGAGGQEYPNCKEVSRWVQMDIETLICVFESVRLMHFI